MVKESSFTNRLYSRETDLRKLREMMREQLTDVNKAGDRHNSYAGLVPRVGRGAEALLKRYVQWPV